MRKVMKRAWEIAKQGQKKFGGNVKEYFVEALRMAWKEMKEGNKMNIENEKFDVKYNEWKNYGKHRVYIDINLSLVELKEVNGNEVGAKRGIVAQYYYDVQEGKMYVRNYAEKDLTRAADEVVKYMKEKVRNKAFEIAENFQN